MNGTKYMIKTLAILFLLTSCGNLPITYIQNFSSVNSVIFGFPDSEITQDVYDDYEFSFIKVKFARGPASILILAYVEDDIYQWVGIEDVSIYTRYGRVIRTTGLPHNFEINDPKSNNIYNSSPIITSTKYTTSNRINNLVNFFRTAIRPADKGSESIYESINLFNPDLYLATLVTSRSTSSSSIVRFGSNVDALKISEESSIPLINWHNSNYYYQNIESGFVEKTKQSLHPRLPVINIEFYYKF